MATIAGLTPDLSIQIKCECDVKLNNSKFDQVVIAIIRKGHLPICRLNRGDFQELTVNQETTSGKKNKLVRVIKPEMVEKINNVSQQIQKVHNQKFGINNNIENTWLELNKIDEKALTDLLKKYPQIEANPYKKCEHVTQSDYENAVRQNRILNELKESLIHQKEPNEWSKQLLVRINSCIRASLAIMNTRSSHVIPMSLDSTEIKNNELFEFYDNEKNYIHLEQFPYGTLVFEKSMRNYKTEKDAIEGQSRIKEKLKCLSTSISQMIMTSEDVNKLANDLKKLVERFHEQNEEEDLLHLGLILAVSINGCKNLITINAGEGYIFRSQKTKITLDELNKENISVKVYPLETSDAIFLINAGIYKNAFDLDIGENGCQSNDPKERVYHRFSRFLKLYNSRRDKKIEDYIGQKIGENAKQIQSNKRVQQELEERNMTTQKGVCLRIHVKS